MTLWQNIVLQNNQTKVLVRQRGRVTRKSEDPCSDQKDPSTDFGRSRTIVAKISFNCECKRAVDGNCCVWKAIRFSAGPAHTNHLVQNWLLDNIDMFWSKEFWPPNSPDLNPLDYYVWSVVERVTNKSRHPNVT